MALGVFLKGLPLLARHQEIFSAESVFVTKWTWLCT